MSELPIGETPLRAPESASAEITKTSRDEEIRGIAKKALTEMRLDVEAHALTSLDPKIKEILIPRGLSYIYAFILDFFFSTSPQRRRADELLSQQALTLAQFNELVKISAFIPVDRLFKYNTLRLQFQSQAIEKLSRYRSLSDSELRDLHALLPFIPDDYFTELSSAREFLKGSSTALQAFLNELEPYLSDPAALQSCLEKSSTIQNLCTANPKLEQKRQGLLGLIAGTAETKGDDTSPEMKIIQGCLCLQRGNFKEAKRYLGNEFENLLRTPFRERFSSYVTIANQTLFAEASHNLSTALAARDMTAFYACLERYTFSEIDQIAAAALASCPREPFFTPEQLEQGLIVAIRKERPLTYNVLVQIVYTTPSIDPFLRVRADLKSCNRQHIASVMEKIAPPLAISPKDTLKYLYLRTATPASKAGVGAVAPLEGSTIGEISLASNRYLQRIKTDVTEEEKKLVDEVSALVEESRLFSMVRATRVGTPSEMLTIAADYMKKMIVDVAPGSKGMCQLTIKAEVGHTILLEFERAPNGTFTFSIYNTGLGCESHLAGEGADRLYPFVVTNISPDKIDNDFCQRLLGFDIEIAKEKVDPKELYDILSSVGTTLKADELKERGVKPYRSQGMVGNCTLKSLSVWLHRTLPEGLYLRYKSGMQKDLLQSIREMYTEMSAKYPSLNPVEIRGKVIEEYDLGVTQAELAQVIRIATAEAAYTESKSRGFSSMSLAQKNGLHAKTSR